MRIGILALLVPLAALPSIAFQRGRPAAPEPPKQTTAGSPYTPFEHLLGHWRGTSTGTLGEAAVEKHFEMVLGGKYLQTLTRSVGKREIHDDLGLMSFDKARAAFVLREFQSDGFVTQSKIDLQDGGKTLVVDSEAIENAVEPGLRARTTWTFVTDDDLKLTYSLAKADEPFEVLSETLLKRTED